MNTEDMLAIQQEIARYSYTFDSGDAEGWANLFVENGVWEYYPSGAGEPEIKLEGRDALREFAEQRAKQRPAGRSSYHHQSGILFDELAGESARNRAMVCITYQTGTEPAEIFLTGVYHDVWRKTQNGWKIVERILRS